MKRFETIKGQEIVYIQGKDLRFLDSQSRTPQNIKKNIKFDHLDINNKEVEFIFSNKEFVEYVKKAKFILNFDDVERMSYEEACEKFERNRNKIESLYVEIKKDLKKKIDVTKKRHDLEELNYYDQSILYILDHKQYGKSLS